MSRITAIILLFSIFALPLVANAGSPALDALQNNYQQALLQHQALQQSSDLPNPDKLTGESWNVTWMSELGTGGSTFGVAVSGNLAYVTDDVNGLRIIDISNPAAPVEVGFLDTAGSAISVVLSGSLAYVADFDDGVRIIDVSNPAAPVEIGAFDTTGYTYDVDVNGGIAYVADAGEGLRVVDVSNPAAPFELGFLSTGAWCSGVAASGNYVYLAFGVDGLLVVDVSSPGSPSTAGVFNDNSYVNAVTVDGNLAYVSDWWGGVRILDVSVPSTPVQVGIYNPSAPVNALCVDGNYLYLAADTLGAGAGFQVLDVSAPATPTAVGYYYTADNALGVAVSNGHAYVGDNLSGLIVLRNDLEFVDILATMTPTAPPVVIGSTGGNFFYNVAIQNTTSQPIVADAVLEAVLPNGNIYHVLTKPGITFPATSTTTRNALSQAVPSGAPAGIYSYRLNIVDASGAVLATDEFPFEKLAPIGAVATDGLWTLKGWDDQDPDPDSLPAPVVLNGAYPNPFNPSTAIRFSLATSARVTLGVFDLRGRLVRNLVACEEMPAGSYSQTWLGNDDGGRTVAGGVYLYRLQAGDFTATRRMTMIK